LRGLREKSLLGSFKRHGATHTEKREVKERGERWKKENLGLERSKRTTNGGEKGRGYQVLFHLSKQA